MGQHVATSKFLSFAALYCACGAWAIVFLGCAYAELFVNGNYARGQFLSAKDTFQLASLQAGWWVAAVTFVLSSIALRWLRARALVAATLISGIYFVLILALFALLKYVAVHPAPGWHAP